MSIQTSCLSRKITIGDRTARVSPPTVRQAVEIMHVLRHLEDDSDVDLLIELLSGLDWQGGIDILVHLRRYAIQFPREFTEILQDIILQGYDPKQETKETLDDDEELDSDTEPDWKRLISQYCTTYPGKDAFDVYDDVPFPFFMEMLPEARRKEAADHIDRAFEASFAMGGSEEMMDRWQEQAGMKTKEEKKKEAYEKELSPEEQKENRKKLKRNFRHG